MSASVDLPLDDVTLGIIRDACGVDPGAERSSLYDTLEVLSRTYLGSVSEQREGDVTVIAGAPSWTPHDVIVALIDEVRRLRMIVNDE